MKKSLFSIATLLLLSNVQAQKFFNETPAAKKWVDSTFKTLNTDDKIAQLMVLRQSGIENGKTVFYTDEILNLLKKYKIGAICPFQGGAYAQALNVNQLQAASEIPLMVCIDGENGLGMRMTDSIQKFPDQLTLGAMNNENLVYQVGQAIAKQCKRMGVQVNYAPVVDINNNPNNPIIGYRSFGENKYVVAKNAIALMRGMQDLNVMACAKHFPGHGDVAVDSHLDLPIIKKSLTSLDSLELYPFKKIFQAGVGSVMIAHLSIPAIDSTPNLATSLSPKNINGLLRNKLHYNGLTFTDALEMKGVAKFFPAGEAAVQSLIAGNDMLCLPGDIDNSILKINTAIKEGKISQEAIDERVKKVLLAKYHLGLDKKQQINPENITADINGEVPFYRRRVADEAITLVTNKNSEWRVTKGEKVAYVLVGNSDSNRISRAFLEDLDATVIALPLNATKAQCDAKILELSTKFDKVIVGIHNASKRPANNFNLGDDVVTAVNGLASHKNVLLTVFGNPYMIKNFPAAQNEIVAYEDDTIFQDEAFKLIKGILPFKGRLPVSAGAYAFGVGVKKNFHIRKS